MLQTEIQSVVRPLVKDYYGDTAYTRSFVSYLADGIEKWPKQIGPGYGSRTREDWIRLTAWDWFTGGTTAEAFAVRVERELEG